MFGTYRYLLASMVILTHLAGIKGAGACAVFGFYCLSGYLMTLVLNRTYGFSPAGTVRFAANRVLRIYPTYWAILLATAAFISVDSGFAGSFHHTMLLPVGIEWFENIFIFGLDYEDHSRLVPPAWSLNVELVFYILMALGLSRWRIGTFLWALASCVFTILQVSNGASFDERYYTVSAASLPFSLGAAFYHAKLRLPKVSPWICAVLAVAFSVNAICGSWIWPDFRIEGFYLSLGLAVATLAALSAVDRERVPEALRRIDVVLGDLAYPVFLLHWLVGLVLSRAISSGEPVRNEAWFLAAVVLTTVAAYALHRSLEIPLEKIRNRVRQRGN